MIGWIAERKRQVQALRYARALGFESLESRAMLTLGAGFAGISNADNLTPTNVPDSIGAAGPSSYVEVLNSSIAIYNKTTGQALPGGGVTSLAEFFRKPAIEFGQPVAQLDTSTYFLIDPVVAYSEATQRFAIGILDWQETASSVKINSRFNFGNTSAV